MSTASTLLVAPERSDVTAAAALQRLVPDLVALTLHAKQAHWNLTGPGFLPLHDLTEELAKDCRAWADRAAERGVALGYSADARPVTVAAVDGGLPGGWLSDREVIIELGALMASVIDMTRQGLRKVVDEDDVAHDIHVEILEGLEKYAWMLRATGT